MIPKNIKLGTLIYDMESHVYHSTPNTYSSSQFKDCLDDEEVFYKKYISKEIERETSDAFDLGSYFHTGVLEPHKLKNDCAVFPGKVRRGDAWEKFKKKNQNKAIITPKQLESAKRLIEAVQDSPVAMGYIERGTPEVSAFLEIMVSQGEIFAPKQKIMLTNRGWAKTEIPSLKKSVSMVVKVRADSHGDDFILDLKSTSGNAKSEKSMRDKVSYYNYDLSAALYLDVFSAVEKKQRDTFIWTFASKDVFNSRSYVASETNILVGRAKYRKAILKIAEGISSKWVFSDYLAVLEPNHYELEYIKQKETDLI